MTGETRIEGAQSHGNPDLQGGSLADKSFWQMSSTLAPPNMAPYLFYDDVDAHCARSRAAGADVLLEPADPFWGDRLYCAVDPEGQFWMFATRHTR
jgi:uncharacterized glyoxalase superfamily protein PhnB